MSIDLVDEIDETISVEPQTISSDTTTNGSAHDVNSNPDLQQKAIIVPGSITDGTFAIKLQEQDDGGSWSDVSSGDLDGSFSDITSSSNNNSIQEVGYLGTKDQIRMVVTSTSTTSGGDLCGLIVAGDKRSAP